MTWSRVGGWIKGNAGSGAALVGSLLTGNIPGAVAAGVSLVSSATGTNNPSEALAQLQQDPETLVRLKELAIENEQSIRSHIEAMSRIELEEATARMSDTNNARVAHRGHWMPPVLTMALIVMVTGLVYMLMNNSLPDGNSEVLYLISGQIIGAFGTAIAYWLGSSRGSAEKQVMLKR